MHLTTNSNQSIFVPLQTSRFVRGNLPTSPVCDPPTPPSAAFKFMLDFTGFTMITERPNRTIHKPRARRISIVPTRPSPPASPTQQSPFRGGWLAKENLRWKRVKPKLPQRERMISEFGYVPDEKSRLFFPVPLWTPHCRRPYLGTSPISKLGTSIDMMSRSSFTTT